MSAELVPRQAECIGQRHEITRIVVEPPVAAPRSGAPVARQVGSMHPEARGGQCRTDAPPPA